MEGKCDKSFCKNLPKIHSIDIETAPPIRIKDTTNETFDVEKSMIVFVETDVFLESTVSFEQRIVTPSNKLVTLIGEWHDDGHKCQAGKSMSIAEYVEQILSRNKKSIVLLEYNKEEHNPQALGSEPIQQITNVFRNSARVIPCDGRTRLLGRFKQDALYQKDLASLEGKCPDEINTFYIQSIINNDGAILFNEFDNCGYTFDGNIIDYFKTVYIPDILNTFRHGQQLLCNSEEYSLVVDAIKEAWKKVADLFFLMEILRKDSSINEIIVVVGEYHARNISVVLSKMPLVSSQTNKAKGNCVNLFETYVV